MAQTQHWRELTAVVEKLSATLKNTDADNLGLDEHQVGASLELARQLLLRIRLARQPGTNWKRLISIEEVW